MAYYGKSFTFDSTPCETYDLMMYNIGDDEEDLSVVGVDTIEDELIGNKWKPYFYGVKNGGKLEFDMTFGVNERRLDAEKYLDSWELSEVTSWLCGHKEYKWLYIDGWDIYMYGYRCMITDLRITQYGSVPWAIKIHVVCDSPYAYLEAKNTTYTINGSRTIDVYNESSLNDWYYPDVEFVRTSGTAFSMTNDKDNNRGPSLHDIPGSVSTITIDNEHCIVDNDKGVNLYEGFNFQFLRLKRGHNNITITGNGTVKIKCEYPINVGG